MWTKLDDALLDHQKVFTAGDVLGKNGPVIVIGLYAIGLMWTNKHLTDGFLPSAVVKRWHHLEQPLKTAQALVAAGLWECEDGGFRVHDFHDHNPTAESVRKKREDDRKRKGSKKDT